MHSDLSVSLSYSQKLIFKMEMPPKLGLSLWVPDSHMQNSILRSANIWTHPSTQFFAQWIPLLTFEHRFYGVVILTIPILVTVRKFRSSLTNAIFRWSTMENSGFATTTRACRWTQFCAVLLQKTSVLKIQNLIKPEIQNGVPVDICWHLKRCVCYQLLWFGLLQNTTFHLLLGLIKI